MLYAISHVITETAYFLFVLLSFAMLGAMPWLLFGN